jgi:tetratricopeptide (TPR) repeat protein
MKRRAALFLLLFGAFAAPAWAQSLGEDEALRQLEFARDEIAAQNYQKAVVSAESALRLSPPLYEALAWKALALEGLGQLKTAESMLITYRELRGNWDRFPDGEASLDRVQGKLGGAAALAEMALPPLSSIAALAEMPDFPKGSEEFLRWMVQRQQIDVAEARLQVGAGLAVGGAVLAAVGGAVLGATSSLSSGDPENPNIRAFYAGGLGAVFSGGALLITGVPLAAGGGVRIAQIKKGATASLRASFGPGAFALRF